ncbi:hypothetical protein [Xinfangfangia pollutisoli]|uniref:hypothetical protein n=1 Tax=Xinfangfangia pollutisoli TaxID=2865960 RepID=UPI001CD2D313|nr:hypothetical protein [Xinfangfangia pollutisoli]
MFKTVAEFLDPKNGYAPSRAERRLIEAVQAGKACVLCDPKNPQRPAAATDTTRIRASLLRLLIIGGTPDCGLHEWGVALYGGWIEGRLDIAYCAARGQTLLNFCHFDTRPIFYNTQLRQLSLADSVFPGLLAQGAKIDAGLVLRRSRSTGTVDVNSAMIGGQFSCIGGNFDGAGGEALNAQGVETGDSVFLSEITAKGAVDVNAAKIGGQLDCTGANFDGAGGKALNAHDLETGDSVILHKITAKGTIDINSAKIGGQLSCTGAKLDGAAGNALNAQGVETGDSVFLSDLTARGTVDLNGAKIGGQLACSGIIFDGAGGGALNAHRMRVSEGLYLRGLAKPPQGRVDLSGAHVAELVDDLASWPTGPDALILDGFTYDRIDGGNNTSFAARRRWLEAGSVWQGEFRPQPYTHLARVLRQMGHSVEARKVLCERERLLAQHRLAADRAAYKRALNGDPTEKGDAGWIWLRMTLARIWSGMARRLAGYGYAPQWSFYWAFALFVFAALLAQLAWSSGGFAPNSAVILTSPGWQEITATDCLPEATPGCIENPAAVWSDKSTPSPSGAVLGVDWDSFNAFAYAADLVVPILDLGQTDAWAPSKDRGFWGWLLWWGRWALGIAGWLVSGLGIAAVTGVMQRNQPD